MKGNKIKATLLIAVFILSTLAIAINVSAVDGIKITSFRVYTHEPEDDAKAEWTIDPTDEGHGYVVKLTTPAEATGLASVSFPYGDLLSTLDAAEMKFLSYSPDVHNPYFRLRIDTEGDGVVDHAIVSKRSIPNPEANWIEQVPEDLWKLYGPANGYDMANYHSLAYWQEELPTTTEVLHIAVTVCPYLPTEQIAYIDDITINDFTYPLEPNYGPVENEITIIGYDATPGGLVNVYWEEVPAGYLAEDSASAISPYTYSIDITIPEAEAGTYGIVVKDMESGTWATTTYTVKPEITLDPTSGVEGDTITVTGTGFAADSEITLSNGIDDIDTIPATVPTDEFGSFICKFDIVEEMTGTVEITATDDSADENSASEELTVGRYIKLTPDRGLIGSTVIVEGRGYTAGETVDIRWYLAYPGSPITVVDDLLVDSTGDISTSFQVPLVSDPTEPAPYTVEAFQTEDIKAEATFTVVEEASITLSQAEGRPETPFTVSGTWFTASSTVTITFDGTELKTGVSTDPNGKFDLAAVEVPDLDPGVYTITATDAEDVTASKTFTILPSPAIVIRTRATEYMPDDTVTFYINSTAPLDINIEIKDPTDYPFTSIAITDEVIEDVYDWWVKVGDWYVVPDYLASFVLPIGATEGLWNWTATYLIEGEEVIDTALFTVGEPVGPHPDISAETTEEETLDPDGVPKTSFALGENIMVSATVANIGTESQPMLVVVQLKDPYGTALAPSSFSVTMPADFSLTPQLGFMLPTTGFATGTWTAKVLVRDNWVVEDGVAIGVPVEVTFEVTD